MVVFSFAFKHVFSVKYFLYEYEKQLISSCLILENIWLLFYFYLLILHHCCCSLINCFSLSGSSVSSGAQKSPSVKNDVVTLCPLSELPPSLQLTDCP